MSIGWSVSRCVRAGVNSGDMCGRVPVSGQARCYLSVATVVRIPWPCELATRRSSIGPHIKSAS
eukprot:5176743-Prymnesium_polylepis.1